MSQFSREEMEEMMRRWLAVNDKAEQEGDWRCLADMYTEDVVYGWDTPNGKYEYNGREVVRETCVGAAMDPYAGWTYPYDKIVIDETRGEAMVTWWQVPPGAPVREDGTEMKVIGASWFKYAGNYEWAEQLDMYDYTNITNLIKECVETGILKEMPTMSSEMVND
ncbi:MAG: hypothetical protein MI746_05435 [Pseudomonadales bacterium]|nr:hypothetical protein [Pseudomonadales bacterium]